MYYGIGPIPYAGIIEGAGAPLDSGVGFIDETNVYIARPKKASQLDTYNDHTRRK